MSLRSRLGGRRAISWQAVVLGDALIVTLATGLAAASAAGRAPIEAATSVFAITMATAVLAAAYTGLMHLTVFRNRAQKPVPISAAVGFHLSIGVLFLVGFAVGATILRVPQLGGSLLFSIAVLFGGLLVCLPTSFLLDHSDRYRAAHRQWIEELTENDRLRVSEWSMRQALRSLAGQITDQKTRDDVVEHLDVLDLSEDTRLSTSLWWQASQAHHQGGSATDAETLRGQFGVGSHQLDFSVVISDLMNREFPTVRWAREFPTFHRCVPPSPGFAAVLVLFMTWLFLTPPLPSVSVLPISLTAAVGAYATYALNRSGVLNVAPFLALLITSLFGVVSAIGWALAVPTSTSAPAAGVPSIALLAGLGSVCALIVAMWVSGVVAARNEQLLTLRSVIDRRQGESTAVFASLTSIVARMADVPSLSGSTALAACATGLQRVQIERDPVRARRIIDWTRSVLAAPGAFTPMSLAARIHEVVHPWSALADISIKCPEDIGEPTLMDDVVAVVDEAVRNACRHGGASSISVNVIAESASAAQIEILDDGSGPGDEGACVGLERLGSRASGGCEVTARLPGPGTRVLVRLDVSRQPDALYKSKSTDE